MLAVAAPAAHADIITFAAYFGATFSAAAVPESSRACAVMRAGFGALAFAGFRRRALAE